VNNGLCPQCGCEVEQEENGYMRDDNGEPQLIEILYTCPCCEYSETIYED